MSFVKDIAGDPNALAGTAGTQDALEGVAEKGIETAGGDPHKAGVAPAVQRGVSSPKEPARSISGGAARALGGATEQVSRDALPMFEDKAITSFKGKEPAAGSFGAERPGWQGALQSISGAAPGSADFSFGFEGAAGAQGPWHHLRVVSFRGTEALSSLYRYEITAIVRPPDPEVDPDDLIQARATFRIASLAEPAFRVVHGIIIEAEELGLVAGGTLYRIVLAPPLARAVHRTRCRIFLEKTTRQIIEAVLLGDPQLQPSGGMQVQPDAGDEFGFTTAHELFEWRVTDVSRIDDVATRPYCVQYNESDWAFISRLLEEEGISYHFEHGDGVCLLVLSDKDGGRTRLDPFVPLGPDISGYFVSSMKLGARLRPRKVSLLDYNWKHPTLDMTVATPEKPSASDLVDHEYPGRYTETPSMGEPLAMAKLDRLEVEASYGVGDGTCRLLAAGSIFALEHLQPRHEGEYLVTKLEARGEQPGALPPSSLSALPWSGVPYTAIFECARRGKNGSPAESRFRPARTTPKPRIYGSQTAFVTAEPGMQGAEIHVGGPPGAEIGCVRVKFHWDTDTARHGKEPTSCWVRVNQVFAGVGEGAVFHPRVGVEAIVDFEEGDPDRPIVVGRVYNGQNRPPGGAPTVSTFKTMSSPATGAFNELTFDDTAGNEQIKMHTPFNWNSDAGNDRSEKVGMNSTSSAGVDRSESTGSNRSTMTGANNSEIIGGNESVTVGANQNVTIGANQTQTIGANQTVTIAGNQTESITGNRTTDVTSNDELTVTGTQNINVTGAQTTTYSATHDLTVASTQSIDVTGEQTIHAQAAQGIKSDTSQKIEAPEQEMTATGKQTLKSANFLADASAEAKITSPTIQVDGSTVEVKGSTVTIKGGNITIHEGNVNVEGGTVTIKGSPITMDGGGQISATAGVIKLN